MTLKKILFGLGPIIAVIGLIFLWYGHKQRVEAQAVYEIACPAGTSPLPFGQTFNPVTQRFRAFSCADVNGNVTIQPETVNGRTSVLQAGSQLPTSPAILSGTCSSTATSSSTLFLYPLGEIDAISCTSVFRVGLPMPSSGTLKNLRVACDFSGVNAASGVFTVLKGAAATSITCTVGTGTTCADTTNTASVIAGDLIAIRFTTQAVETIGSCRATLEKQ